MQIFAINKPCLATNSNRTNKISILYTTDDGYFAPTIVSMESALQSMSENTFYDFHLMVNGEFSKKDDLEKFKIINRDKCSITTHDMGDDFKKDWTSDWPPSMYYRLKAASVLRGIDKCIYIDGDTLIVKDLSELFNINLGDNYLGGVLDAMSYRKFPDDSSTEDCKNYINSGVALINLKKIREDKKEKELLQKVQENTQHNKFGLPDQDIWNIVFKDKIKLLPIKYNFMTNLFMVGCAFTIDQQNKMYGNEIYLNNNVDNKFGFYPLVIRNTLENDHPTIVHFVCNKPWKAGCGVNDEGKNREVWEPLYKKWRETADSVKQNYGIFIEYKSGLFSNPYVKWGTIVGGSTLLTTAIVGTGIAIKKFYDKKIAKKSNPKFLKINIV
ncbi:MAG: glycosyltransferase family 8 protein [Clostridia bacterium]|nr:glycosyltransferase family 8 protein [Clostridia bacterium]